VRPHHEITDIPELQPGQLLRGAGRGATAFYGIRGGWSGIATGYLLVNGMASFYLMAPRVLFQVIVNNSCRKPSSPVASKPFFKGNDIFFSFVVSKVWHLFQFLYQFLKLYL
jgi:hypothetical protein